LDADTQTWLQSKGHHSKDAAAAAAALAQQYRQLESYRGIPGERILALPEDMTAPGALDQVYAKLGRPGSAADYTFPVAQDKSDQPLAEALAPVAHKLGLSQKQAEALFVDLRDMTAKEIADGVEQHNTANQASHADLQRKWGDNFPINMQIARQTAQKLVGNDAAVIERLEEALGYGPVIEMFHKIGAASGEAPYIGGVNAQQYGVTTPEAAAAKLKALEGDAEFRKKFMAGDTEARQKHHDLARIASGGR